MTNALFPFDAPEDRQPIIVAARRTPIGRAGGALTMVAPEDLAAPVINAVIADARLDPAQIDDVILGNAAGGGGNIARLSALTAGLPVSVPGVTMDRQCGAGLEAINTACHLIAAGAGHFYLAGGVESVSRAPWRVAKPMRPGDVPQIYARARFSPDDIGDPEMGIAAENVAECYAVSRERQDALALQSHERAVAAAKAGRFDREIVPVAGIVADECPRPDTSLAKLAKLHPVFRDDGTVTAGNSCPLNDGAAVVVVTSVARAKALGLTRGLVFAGAAAAGVDPNVLGIGPVSAMQKLTAQRPHLSMADATVIEFNEAFAAQVLASLDQLEVDPVRVNLEGGALALGHPFGASGAILVTRMFGQLIGDNRLGFAMLGIGGGMGLATAFRAWSA